MTETARHLLRETTAAAAELVVACAAGVLIGAAALAFSPTQRTAWTIIAICAAMFVVGLVSFVHYRRIAIALLGASAGPVIGVFVLVLMARGS